MVKVQIDIKPTGIESAIAYAPFARQLWFGSLGGRSELGGRRGIASDFGVRGVEIIKWK